MEKKVYIKYLKYKNKYLKIKIISASSGMKGGEPLFYNPTTNKKEDPKELKYYLEESSKIYDYSQINIYDLHNADHLHKLKLYPYLYKIQENLYITLEEYFKELPKSINIFGYKQLEENLKDPFPDTKLSNISLEKKTDLLQQLKIWWNSNDKEKQILLKHELDIPIPSTKDTNIVGTFKKIFNVFFL